MNKLVILARLAFGVWIDPADVSTIAGDGPGRGRRGITGVDAGRHRGARSPRRGDQALAEAAARDGGRTRRSRPRSCRASVPSDSPFGRTAGVLNRIEIEAEPVGTVAFSGPGAGGPATVERRPRRPDRGRPRARQHLGGPPAGGERHGRLAMTPSASAGARPTLVDRYRAFLPVTDATPVLSLGEGMTPLVPSAGSARRLGLDRLYAKIEGQNPTGSFKDRGMVVAVAKAVEDGARAIICASTGNTSASAAAYGAAHGLEVVVVLPAGQIAMGKLLQAIIAGARIVAIDGNFDAALRVVRALAEQDDHPVTLVNSVNPYRLEGQKTGAFEICDDLGRAPGRPRDPGRQRRQHQRLLGGFREYAAAGLVDATPRMFGFQAAGRRAARPRPAGRGARDDRDGDPDRQPRVVGRRRSRRGTRAAAAIEAVTDDEILAA